MAEPTPANLERFCGLAEGYDAHRPHPPRAIVELLTQLARAARPRLVVDLGSGTGLSTRLWAGRAERVVGIEPNPDMRRQAEQHSPAPGDPGCIAYQEGHSSRTGLPDACADILTCSQCFHWMEPGPTLAEVARILRPGGVFAAYDCDWPPAMNWEAEAAFRIFMNTVGHAEQECPAAAGVKSWPKEEHLANLKASARFRYVREVLLHSVESGSAARLVGLALSFGGTGTLLRAGASEERIGLPRLREEARRTLGDTPLPWYFSYRVRIGVK